ncbi:hypothetical protein GCM10027290_15780 [Micromonospora sonneratiae]
MSLKLRHVLATTAAALLVAAAPAAPASAGTHSQSPPDGGGYGGVTNSWHQGIQACDTSANNRGIRIEYTQSDTTGNVYTLGDANGSSSGCGSRHVGPYEVLSFRVCSSVTGGGDDKCSSWLWIAGS